MATCRPRSWRSTPRPPARPQPAIDCWERAGEEAIARPAYKEAIAHLEAAIRLCRQLSADPVWLRRECQLQIRLGQALLEHLGYQATATMAAFERARELAEQIGEPSLLVPSMYGLWANRYVSGMPAPELATRFAELTASGGGPRARAVWRFGRWPWSASTRVTTVRRCSSSRKRFRSTTRSPTGISGCATDTIRAQAP